MRQIITIQVGQCGNQVGHRFWDLLLNQHRSYNKSHIYDDALSSFFRNVDSKSSNLEVGSQLQYLKARTVVVDMEEGVINQLIKSKLGDLYEIGGFVKDVSGAGNNWAHGHFEYGGRYRTLLTERIGKQVERCDSLQSFFLIHSIGGGTGSGLGSYIVGLLQDEFPDIFRFTASVFPSTKNDDVNTSPYNSMFSLYELMKHSDCTMPIDNQALIGIVRNAQSMSKTKQKAKQNQGAYDKMNNIIAHLLSNLTCSMRFQGILNVDFNEITMNLVPYPDLHFLVSSMSPLYSLADPRLQPRKLDEIFNDIYMPEQQLIQSSPKSHTYLAMGLILRGNVGFSDVNRNIKQLRDKKDLRFVYWNNQGFKYGICNTPPIGLPYSILCLANNTCIKTRFKKMLDKFNAFYNKGVYKHHYLQYMQESHFTETRTAVSDLIQKYGQLQKLQPPKTIPKLKPILL